MNIIQESFDRGHDAWRRDPSEGSASPGKPVRTTRNRLFAVALVVIMVASAFAMAAPHLSKKASDPVDQLPAKTAQVGPPEVDMTMSNIGESYKKSTVYADHGRHTGPMGLNNWFLDEPLPPSKTRNYRTYYYGDMPVRNTYPYVVAYPPYSGYLSASTPDLFQVASFYRLTIDAKNITGLGTGPDKDPAVLPILAGGPDPLGLDGGNVQMWLYLTYITYNETVDIEAGTHYANTYYGVPAGAVKWGGAAYYDGWWMEAQGRWQFDRLACAKFLGISGTDLRTSFNTANAANALGIAWANAWGVDGSHGGDYNIYAAYDYTLDYGPVDVFLSLDPDGSHSSPDSISVLMWSRSWGAEVLFARYMDATGVRHTMQPYMEDWYLNGTLNSEFGNVQERLTTVYHMTAWKDSGFSGPSWMIEGQHIDYTADYGPPSPDWVSQYDPYFQYYYAEPPYPDPYLPDRLSWNPGQSTYGTRIHYWTTPMAMSLASGESLTVKVPTGAGWGVTPYTDPTDTLDATKIAQLNSHGAGGEWVLGHGWPSWYYSATYYNAASKTLTFNGPMSFDRNVNPISGYAALNETGSPMFLLDISPVSHYKLEIVEAGPYSAGVQYNLRVTPQDMSNANVLCTQTVELPAIANVVYGSPTTHTFLISESSWTTTVKFNAQGTYNLVSQDQFFYLDISDVYSFEVGPPAGFIINLVVGWNFFTVPGIGHGYNSSNLGLQMMDQVVRWNPASKTYDRTFIVGVTPVSQAFNIEPLTGYWVYKVKAQTLTLMGSAPTSTLTRTIDVPTGGGWAIIAVNSFSTTLMASSIPPMYSGGGQITQVADYLPPSGTYKIYTPLAPPSNYALTPGHAYWVWCTADGTLTQNP